MSIPRGREGKGKGKGNDLFKTATIVSRMKGGAKAADLGRRIFFYKDFLRPHSSFVGLFEFQIVTPPKLLIWVGSLPLQ